MLQYTVILVLRYTTMFRNNNRLYELLKYKMSLYLGSEWYWFYNILVLQQ